MTLPRMTRDRLVMSVLAIGLALVLASPLLASIVATVAAMLNLVIPEDPK